MLSTLPPLCAERYLKWFCRDGVDMDSVLIWLGDAQAIYRWQEYYSHLVERVAQLNGCDVMQLRDAFLVTPQKHGRQNVRRRHTPEPQGAGSHLRDDKEEVQSLIFCLHLCLIRV